MIRDQWYPGHINKAKRNIKTLLKQSNSILLVLDSRAPYSSTAFTEFKDIKKKKRVLILLNKSDMADKVSTKEWEEYYISKGFDVLPFSIKRPVKKEVLINKLKLKDHITKILVLGIPNVGKSTILNYLIGKKSAKTGNRAGVTRGVQWVQLDSTTLLLDTPGILFSNLSNQNLFEKLCYIRSLNIDKIDIIETSYKLILFLKENYPKYLYKLSIKIEDEEPSVFLKKMCIEKNFILRGGIPDIQRGAFYIFNVITNGKLGRITYERVNDEYVIE